MIYTLGIDPGFASSPMGCALLYFENEPRLVESFSLRPRCGGGWQDRQYDILDQLNEWLEDRTRMLPAPLLLAYACAHLREAKDAEDRPLHKGKKERANSTHVTNPQTALKLAELGGAIRGLAVAHGVGCIGVQEAESKIALTKDSRATKQDMIAAASRIFGVQLDEHSADACAHALAGQAAWHRQRIILAAGNL